MNQTNLKHYALPEIPYYKVHGRTFPGANPLPLFYTGSAIEFLVSGSEFRIELSADYTAYEPWITIEINGEMISRQMLQKGDQQVCAFRGMNPDITKSVRLTRELQGMRDDGNCSILITGADSDGTFSPVPQKKYLLEFIGDSITSGEGTYGAKVENDWLPVYMSYSKNYAKMISDALEADCHIISQGGWGVLSGWDNNPNCTLPSVYEKLCGLCSGPVNEKTGAFTSYDFSLRKADAIIVNLGTNDAGAFDQPAWTDPVSGISFKQGRNPDGTMKEEHLLRFQQAVKDFLYMLRQNNPESHIVWCYGMLGYSLSLPINEAIAAYIRDTNDHNIMYLQLPDTPEDSLGSRCHPGIRSHERSAKILTEYLKTVLK